MSAAPSRRRRRSPSAPNAPRCRYRSVARTATEFAASARVESCRPSAAYFIEQPGARQPNIAMDGGSRRADRGGDLVIRQAAEIVQFNDLGQARFHLLEALEGVIERNHVEVHRRQRLARIPGKRLSDSDVALHPRSGL